ncbi:MAG: hypothetical protein ACI89X_000505 [Planctomycetota bacterium]|jgi:hypothetical protein
MPTDPVASQLRPLLAKQLGRLRNRYLLFGVAKAVLWVAALVVMFFVLDRWLRLPTPIRLLHLLAAGGIGVYAIRHFVRYPLSKKFTEIDLALWLEHTYPELHQRLVSAVQLHNVDSPELRNQSRAMIDQLWQETAARTQELKLDALFDNRALGRVMILAGVLCAGLIIGSVVAPETARTFAMRHVGFQIDYPRDTTLIVDLPPAGPDLQREDRDGVTEIIVPAGADLHVSVQALGTVPKEVFLQMSVLKKDGSRGTERSVPMTPRPGDRFRHVFRRLSGSMEFHARGGDDDNGDRRVIVHTVRPAQVATLKATVVPPAYTGVESLEQVGGAIEALVGSHVDLLVFATAPVNKATMVFLEDGRRVDLSPTNIIGDSGAATEFLASFEMVGSDRYQIELLADNGLRNPNPGTYPISALQDYAPIARWLLPEDDTLALLPTALLCMRIEARDDFGLTDVQLTIERSGEQILTRSLLPADQKPPLTFLPTELFEINELLGGDSTGDGLFVQLTLLDNKVPEAGSATLPRRIVQIVDPPELAALIAKSFRRLREEVTSADSIQTDRRNRLNDLLNREKETGAATDTEVAQILTGIEVGQGRIATSVSRMHRGLMRAFDLHLWNRLETSQHAATVVELFQAHSAQLTEPVALDPTFYRDLTLRRKAGTLGAMEATLDPILQMIDMTDQLAQNDVPQVQGLLAKAQVARGEADRTPLLVKAQAHQQHIEEVLKQLLLRLEEWNDYQDLVQEVRALRDRQRDLQNRTEQVKGK